MWDPVEVENESCSNACREVGTSVIQSHGAKFCCQSEWVWRRVLPQSLRMGFQMMEALLQPGETLNTEPRWSCWDFWPRKLHDDTCAFKYGVICHSSDAKVVQGLPESGRRKWDSAPDFTQGSWVTVIASDFPDVFPIGCFTQVFGHLPL